MNITHDDVIAVSSAVTALSVTVVWWQARLLRKQVEADHERSRRELTIHLIQTWNRSVSPFTAAAERVTNGLNDDQCRNLAQMSPFWVNENLRPMLETALADVISAGDALRPVNGRIELNQRHVTRLRFLVVDYLNETEAVLQAWLMGVGDRQTLEEEFQFLADRRHGYNAVEAFRTALGIELWPAVQAFIDAMRKRAQLSATPRPTLPAA